ncbi:hypothetical protein [Nocardia sp. NPDC059691]|uniref:hypothetical protein n=1 Tax=Nocardia sp. NPDC059691 TaxID=3346908 RepID=UPI00369DCDED
MDIFAFACRVAAELGPGWTARPHRYYSYEAELHGPDEEQLALTDGDHSHRRNDHGRVLITGHYGELGTHLHDRDKADPITVGAARHPALIAADIESRLLPPYRAALAHARPRANAEAARAQRREEILAALPQILAPADRIHDNVVYLGGNRPVSGKVTVNAQGGAHVELDIDARHVLTFARAIAASTHPADTPTSA